MSVRWSAYTNDVPRVESWLPSIAIILVTTSTSKLGLASFERLKSKFDAEDPTALVLHEGSPKIRYIRHAFTHFSLFINQLIVPSGPNAHSHVTMLHNTQKTYAASTASIWPVRTDRSFPVKFM